VLLHTEMHRAMPILGNYESYVSKLILIDDRGTLGTQFQGCKYGNFHGVGMLSV
jgi:hypothetical protein